MQRIYTTRFLIGLVLLITVVGALVSEGAALGIHYALGDALDNSNSPFVTVPNPTPIPLPKPKLVLTVSSIPPELAAKAALLYDVDSGQTLVDINGERSLPMASTTKIMTALVALRISTPDQVLTVPQEAVTAVLQNNGSNAGLATGEKLTVRDLIYGLMLPSGNDAAITLADGLAGSQENFVNTMNLYAHRLHLFQTNFTNPDGFDDNNHYTSAFDLVKMTRYAMTIPTFNDVVKTSDYQLAATLDHHEHKWTTTNFLLDGQQGLKTYDGLTGVKTGTTPDAGSCLVFSATHTGHHLIGAILHSNGSDDEITRFKDTTKLLDWGFNLPMQVPKAGPYGYAPQVQSSPYPENPYTLLQSR